MLRVTQEQKLFLDMTEITKFKLDSIVEGCVRYVGSVEDEKLTLYLFLEDDYSFLDVTIPSSLSHQDLYRGAMKEFYLLSIEIVKTLNQF